MEPDMQHDRAQVWVLCDFDGTISVRDVGVSILDKFAQVDDWRAIEKHILQQGGKSYQYLPAVYAGWCTRESDVLRFVDEEIQIDPAFPRFVSLCRAKGYKLEIVSDGLNIYIERLLSANGLDGIPYTSNVVELSRSGAYFRFPHRSLDCGKCGNCKKQRVITARARGAGPVVYIGDGISDHCPAREADIVFAKDKLRRYCQANNIDFILFNNFDDIMDRLPGEVQKYQRGSMNYGTA